MSRRNREKRHHAPQPESNSKLFLGLGAVKLLKDALAFFERFLDCQPDTLSNVPFAREVTAELRIKLEDMLQREEWEKDTPFDYNEIHLLHTSLQMYLIELQFTYQRHLIPPCTVLCRQFGVIAKHVERETRSQH